MRLGWVLTCTALLASGGMQAVRAEEGPEKDPPEALVERLGDAEFEVRKEAAKRLVKFGMAAREALEEGLHHGDSEVRFRCRRILAKVLEQDFQRRVEAFAADTVGKEEHELPGWERYRALVGEKGKARKLFVEMLREEGGLIETAESGGQPAADVLRVRLSQVYRRAFAGRGKQREAPSLGTVAALFFVAADPRLDDAQREELDRLWVNLTRHTTVRNAMQKGDQKENIRRLVSEWLRVSPVDRLRGNRKLIMALRYNLKGGLEPALELIDEAQQYPPHVLAYALLIVGKLGGAAHAEALQPLLDDKRLFTAQTINKVRYDTQIRDVALAVLIHLAGKKPKDFGFKRLQANKIYLFSPNSLGFADEASRTKALEKWRQTLRSPEK